MIFCNWIILRIKKKVNCVCKARNKAWNIPRNQDFGALTLKLFLSASL